MGTISFIREFSLLIGIWVAIYGIDSWRREHRGKREIELAEDVLTLFYEARDAIKYMRHPVSSADEWSDVEKSPNETEAQWQARKDANVAYKRYNDRKDLFNKIYAMRYRFMAQIGPAQAQPFEDLNQIVHNILISAQLLARLWPRDYFHTKEQYEQHQKRVEKYEAVFWEGLQEDDPINPKLEAIIESMEKTCREIITGKGTLYAFLNRPLWRRNS